MLALWDDDIAPVSPRSRDRPLHLQRELSPFFFLLVQTSTDADFSFSFLLDPVDRPAVFTSKRTATTVPSMSFLVLSVRNALLSARPPKQAPTRTSPSSSTTLPRLPKGLKQVLVVLPRGVVEGRGVEARVVGDLRQQVVDPEAEREDPPASINRCPNSPSKRLTTLTSTTITILLTTAEDRTFSNRLPLPLPSNQLRRPH